MYELNDIAVIIPTKDRPEKIEKLLKNFSELNENLGKIIIVSSGKDLTNIINKYKNILPLSYYKTSSGQVHQRNFGISKLDNSTKLVATLDDDVTILKNSFINILNFWKSCDLDTAGIGFNILRHNFKRKKNLFNYLKNLIIKNDQPGKILRSGINTPIHDLEKDIKTQWLNGGATVWRQEILINFKNKGLNTKWAVYEDVLFSYPISKIYPLYISSNSKIKIEETHSENNNFSRELYNGKSVFLCRLKLINSFSELSYFSFFLISILTIFYYFFVGLFKINANSIFRSLGYLTGLIIVLTNFKHIKKVDDLIKHYL